jgi:hypothetical protein
MCKSQLAMVMVKQKQAEDFTFFVLILIVWTLAMILYSFILHPTTSLGDVIACYQKQARQNSPMLKYVPVPQSLFEQERGVELLNCQGLIHQYVGGVVFRD